MEYKLEVIHSKQLKSVEEKKNKDISDILTVVNEHK